ALTDASVSSGAVRGASEALEPGPLSLPGAVRGASGPPPGGGEVELRALAIPTATPLLPSPAARPPAPAHDPSVVMVPIERLDELIRLVGESAGAHLRVGRLLWERVGLARARIPRVSGP